MGEQEQLGGREPTTSDLDALARHANQQAALYRRRTLLGRGEPRRLAELERVAAGAVGRLKRARARQDPRGQESA